MQNNSINNLEIIFREDGLIKRMKPDYVPRPSQIEAANQILSTLYNKDIQIVEGPCGFGKTFAYLVPLFEFLHQASIPNIDEETNETIDEGERKVSVIVTNGISLQEQLYYKDLPLVRDIFKNIYSNEKKFAILKGKSNFACIRKTYEALETFVPFDRDNRKEKELQIQWNAIKQWYSTTTTGDFSDLDFVPDSQILMNITCGEDGECLGKKCGAYEECYYQRHKNKAMGADIVITNYHVLFWDLEFGMNTLLPDYDVLIFDEAHEVADIYRDFKANKFSLGTLKSIRNNIKELRNKYKVAEFLLGKKKDETKEFYLEVFDELYARTEDYFEVLYRTYFKDNKWAENKVIEGEVQLPNSFHLIQHIETLQNTVKEAFKYIKDKIDEETADEDDVKCAQGFVRIDEKLLKIKKLLYECNISRIRDDIVFWIDKDEDRTEGQSMKHCDRISVNFKPVDVADLLYNSFFYNPDLTSILTSATLSVGGGFDYIKTLLGLDIASKEQHSVVDGVEYTIPARNIKEFMGISPFNLKDQQLWYLPPDAVDGNTPEFDKMLSKLILDTTLECCGGALCLFTSVKNMNETYKEIRYRLQRDGYTVFKQGDMPKIKLLEAFKNDVDSVLFATRSFFTGVDIPGEALRCLIIDKLPFPSPGDPVMQKLAKQDNSFFKYFVPMMIITLKQAVGRGVRSITDKCVICILDNRMATARYKMRIAHSFPGEKTRTRDLKELSKFLDIGNKETNEWDALKGDYDDEPSF